MPVELIDEQQLYDALQPFRPDRAAFERGVQDYLQGRAGQAEQDPFNDLPPLARAAAGVLPLPLLTGGKISTGTTVSSGGIGQKLIGIALFPAVSLFVLLGATILSVIGIRATQQVSNPKLQSAADYDTAIKDWWATYWLPAILLFVGMLALMLCGVSGWFFPLVIASFGLLVVVVRSLAKRGLGNRLMLAAALQTPLLLIGQLTMMFNFGAGEIHLLDPRIVSYVFWAGLFCLGFISFRMAFGIGRIHRGAGLIILLAFYTPIAIILLAMLRVPPSPDAIKQHVEAFNRARFESATWREWEIPARWTIEAGWHPDLAAPRKLFEQELAGKQNPFILGIAFRVGLVTPADLPHLRDLEIRKRLLLEWGQPDIPILSLDQSEWVIRALVMNGELDDAQRDFLAARLQATMSRAGQTVYSPLSEVLLITQLLAAIDRPVDPAQHRDLVQALLLNLHCMDAGGFQPAGGFKLSSSATVSDPSATAVAVELMQIYGVPKGLDLNWVRSYAKPNLIGSSTSKWTSAITRWRLAAIPGVEPPRVWQRLYYARNLLAAMVLVGLCIYAVIISPVVYPRQPEDATQPAHG